MTLLGGHWLRWITSYSIPVLKAFDKPCILLEMNLEHERRQLVFAIKVALTQEQVQALKVAVNSWLKASPEDVVIRRVARELVNKEAWLKKKGEWH
jgi:hypothetical protein